MVADRQAGLSATDDYGLDPLGIAHGAIRATSRGADSLAVTLCVAPARFDREFSLWHQPVLHREERGRPTRGHTDLAVHVLDVVAGRLDRDSQHTRDLLGLQPTRQEPDDLRLALGQPRRSFDSWSPLACGLQHRPDGERIEPPGTHLVGQRLGGLRRSERLPVRPRFDLGLVGICGGKQACPLCKPWSSGSTVIARPVAAFVVRTGETAECGQKRRAVEDAFGLVGMQSYLLPVVGRQRAALLPCGPARLPARCREPGPPAGSS
jgi:hypothetical protein